MNNGRFLMICGIGLVSLTLWASNSYLDIVVRGSGKIIPAMKTQVLQNLEGGIISEVLVIEGESVSAGQNVARLESATYKFTVNEMERKLVSLQSRLDRLVAELDGAGTPTFRRAGENRATSAIASELTLFQARRSDLDTRKETSMLIVTEN